MDRCESLCRELNNGEWDECLAALYAPDGAALDAARERALRVVEGFRSAFGPEGTPPALFSAPGRTELGGNHTDHQRGRVLCTAVDLDILACAAPNGTSIVRIRSEGYPDVDVDLRTLLPQMEERGTSAALVRGVAARLEELGRSVCGFDVWMTSDVPGGAGLSSSAAYEVLLGTICNRFFCADDLSAADIAAVGQYAENQYFGKPCGLMDQMACAVGGAVAIDFADLAAPRVRRVDCDLAQYGHALCIVDTGGSHADLTEDYAAIPREMGAVAACFGKTCLREVAEQGFRVRIPELRARCGERAVLRAMHFFAENRRAAEQAEALERGEFERFLTLVNASGLSSALLLQNVWTQDAQAIALALAVGRDLLAGTGAIRVHGGGFAGTVQAFVPLERLEEFRRGMDALFGPGRCRVLRLRARGGCQIKKELFGG